MKSTELAKSVKKLVNVKNFDPLGTENDTVDSSPPVTEPSYDNSLPDLQQQDDGSPSPSHDTAAAPEDTRYAATRKRRLLLMDDDDSENEETTT